MQAAQAVGRRFGAYHLPKPPGLTPPVSQVGLGTARSFHSSRPLFQNLVDNAPISLRAFIEADWELETKGKKPVKMEKRKEAPEVKKTKEMAKPAEKKVVHRVSETQIEFDHYFVTPPAEVITNLLVPLVPTPSSRQSLPSTPSPSLIPLSILLDVHASHELHSLRASSLFSRLDAAKVWLDPRVSCSVYGDPSGLASIMKIEFKGWTKTQVRAVLGEAGKGWCMMQEFEVEDFPDSAPPSPSLSGISSPCSGYSTPVFGFEEEDSVVSDPSPEYDVDPSSSLVIPALDLSNHEAWADNSPRVPEHIDIPAPSSHSELDLDYDTDGSSEYDLFSNHSDSTGVGWMMMSSRVSEVDDGPRERMF